jgi:RHS repeat-associated protein
VQQNYTLSGSTESTFYIGGLMDIVIHGTTTDYRHYVYAGSEPVAVYSRTSAAVNTMSYMLEDHQGSISTIASKAGAVDVNESFSAFGTRRNPASWSGAPSAGDLNTIAGLSRQGYTFQTALGQSMGLNHMNGRVEDAILGRFLSPDPHIPDPSDAQSYNRYTYVNNNPVTNIDPTGFCGEATSTRELKVAEGACFGAGGGGASIPIGSVQGISATSVDAFSNLNDVGTPDTAGLSNFISAVSNASGTIADKLSGVNANNITRDTQSGLPGDASSAAQSQAPQNQTSYPCPDCESVTVTAVAYQGAFHDRVVAAVATNLAANGDMVALGPLMCFAGSTGSCAKPDVFYRAADGSLNVIEVKTGDNPGFTPGQLNVYPHLAAGGLVQSASPQLLSFGIPLGAPLPPVNGWIMLVPNGASVPMYVEFSGYPWPPPP